MSYDQKKFDRYLEILKKCSPNENLNRSDIYELLSYKVSDREPRKADLDQSVIWVVGQGEKICYSGDQVFHFKPGQVLVLVYPMSVEIETITATPESPFLAGGLGIRRERITNLLVKMEQNGEGAIDVETSNPSGIFSFPLNDEILDIFLRLFDLLNNPMDQKMLSAQTVEEAYYRVLKYDRAGNIRTLLKHNGAYQRISRAVEYVNENLNKSLTSEELASIANMSQTTFYEHFKNVMHVTPLNYIKVVKLHEAQKLLKLGKNVNETAELIGYGNYAQFSREFKRRYGKPPSKI